MLGRSEAWDRGGGAFYPLKAQYAHLSLVRLRHESQKWVFGFVESIEPKSVLCWGTQRHGVAAWGVVRLFGVLGYWECTHLTLETL